MEELFIELVLCLRGCCEFWEHSSDKSIKHPYSNKAGLPRWLVIKNPPANAGDIRDAGLTPGLERSPGRKGMETQ